MIYGLMKIITTLFLCFALYSFLWFAYERRKDASQLIGNIVSAGFMASAIYFIWL